MNEQERIIELVRNNVITMEEALDLLEAASHAEQVKTSPDASRLQKPANVESEDQNNQRLEGRVTHLVEDWMVKGKGWAKQVEDYFSEEGQELTHAEEESQQSHQEEAQNKSDHLRQEANVLLADIDQLQEELNHVLESLTINQQRQRELEVFAELDSLTEEMEVQRQDLQVESKELEASKDKITEDIEDKEERLSTLYKMLGYEQGVSEKEGYSTHQNPDLKQTAQDLGNQAAKSGRQFTRFIRDQVSDLANHFNMREMEFNVSVPWLKSDQISHQYTYDADQVQDLAIDIVNGGLKVIASEEDQVVLGLEVTFFGNHDQVSIEAFEAHNNIGLDQDQLTIQAVDKRYAVSGVLRLPNKVYQEVNIKLTNGDLELNHLEASQVQLNLINGDLEIEGCQLSDLDIDLVNGDVAIYGSSIKETAYNNVNGDLRIVGPVGNLEAEAVNANMYITKQDINPAIIRLKTMTGNLKVALPSLVSLETQAKVNLGEVKNRLSRVGAPTELKESKSVYLERSLDQAPEVSLVLRTRTGDIYLKDSDPGGEEE